MLLRVCQLCLFTSLLWSFFLLPAATVDDIVINEINYNPPEDGATEFIELFNPTDRTIDLSQYSFTDGIFYSFPPLAKMDSGEYVILVKYNNSTIWRNTVPSDKVYGPYLDDLDDGGELIRLRSRDGRIIDEVEYDDYAPWSAGADGYGPSLERIDPALPSNDYHSWRASTAVSRTPSRPGGTPGRQNSVVDVPPKPTITRWEVNPPHPTSRDSIQVQVTLDGGDQILSASLRWETIHASNVSLVTINKMNLLKTEDDQVVFSVTLPRQTSQTLVRMAVEISSADNVRIILPYSTEPRPFHSIFVYDNDIPSLLPILWFYDRISTRVQGTSKSVTGVVIKPVDTENVLVFDGARIVSSRNGNKIRFLKHEEYLGNRTLNLIPERPGGSTTAGPQSPHVEQLSYRIFADFGVLVPGCDWYRVINRGNHTQQILIQQPNEKFLEIHNRDATANIYKIAYNEPGGHKKMTNLNEGEEDFNDLLRRLNSGSEKERERNIRRYLVFEEVMNYSVAGVCMSNWDGFFNNMFLYHDPFLDQWECIPWDLDKTFGFTDSNPMFVEMPVDYPLDGRARVASRPPGLISGPFHSVSTIHEDYKIRLRKALDGLFSQERITAMIDEMEDMLLEDLKLQGAYTQKSTTRRRNQILDAYQVMRTFLQLRHEYLRSVLPVSIQDWQLY